MVAGDRDCWAPTPPCLDVEIDQSDCPSCRSHLRLPWSSSSHRRRWQVVPSHRQLLGEQLQKAGRSTPCMAASASSSPARTTVAMEVPAYQGWWRPGCTTHMGKPVCSSWMRMRLCPTCPCTRWSLRSSAWHWSPWMPCGGPASSSFWSSHRSFRLTPFAQIPHGKKWSYSCAQHVTLEANYWWIKVQDC